MIEDKIVEWQDSKHPYCNIYSDLLKKFPKFLNRLATSEYVGHKVFEETKLLMINKKDIVLEQRKLLENMR